LPSVDLSISSLYRHSNSTLPRLRVGVLMDGPNTLACFRQVLEDIIASDYVELACVVINNTPRGHERDDASWFGRLLRTLSDGESRRQFLYTLYLRVFDSRYHTAGAPTAKVDCSDLIRHIPTIHVIPDRQRFVHRLPVDAVQTLQDYQLDVILRFGFNILRGSILSAARFGVWSYHHGDSEYYRGGPPHAWELIESNPLSGVVLQRLIEDLDAGPVLAKAVLATTATPSVSRNRFAPFWVGEHFVIRVLHDLHEHGWAFVEGRSSTPAVYKGRRTIYRTPANRDVAVWMARTAIKKLRERLKGPEFTFHWQLALRRSTNPLYADSSTEQLKMFQWFESPAGHFWADPVLFTHEGSTWVFFEDYDYLTRRASISCAPISSEGRLGTVRSALQRPYHLSYPLVFVDDGAIYMVPESAQSGSVELYRATRFPDEWVLDRTLIHLRAVDATPFKYEGRWWMFLSPLTVSGHAPITLLFSASALTGPWRYAPASPIASDVRCARGAGPVLRDGGRLLRPAQDCSVNYGRSLVFHEVIRISDMRYDERPIVRIDPGWRPRQAGVHSFSREGDLEAIDGLFRRNTRHVQ